jgi:Ribonuclease G/E
MTEEEKLKNVRRAYILARALNIQYSFIRDYVNSDLKKIMSDAKAKNAHFIKTIDNSFAKRRQNDQMDHDEEIAFQLLEALENKFKEEKL